jgi:hypothetical protein
MDEEVRIGRWKRMRESLCVGEMRQEGGVDWSGPACKLYLKAWGLGAGGRAGRIMQAFN